MVVFYPVLQYDIGRLNERKNRDEVTVCCVKERWRRSPTADSMN